MADGSVGTKSNKAPNAACAKRAASPDIYPAGTQMRLCTVVMALQGATVLFNDIMDGSDAGCGVMATLDLAIAELTRINNEMEAFSDDRIDSVVGLKQEASHE